MCDAIPAALRQPHSSQEEDAAKSQKRGQVTKFRDRLTGKGVPDSVAHVVATLMATKDAGDLIWGAQSGIVDHELVGDQKDVDELSAEFLVPRCLLKTSPRPSGVKQEPGEDDRVAESVMPSFWHDQVRTQYRNVCDAAVEKGKAAFDVVLAKKGVVGVTATSLPEAAQPLEWQPGDINLFTWGPAKESTFDKVVTHAHQVAKTDTRAIAWMWFGMQVMVTCNSGVISMVVIPRDEVSKCGSYFTGYVKDLPMHALKDHATFILGPGQAAILPFGSVPVILPLIGEAELDDPWIYRDFRNLGRRSLPSSFAKPHHCTYLVNVCMDHASLACSGSLGHLSSRLLESWASIPPSFQKDAGLKAYKAAMIPVGDPPAAKGLKADGEADQEVPAPSSANGTA